MKTKHLLPLVLAVLFANACAVGPQYTAPKLEMPEKFSATAESQHAPNLQDWWLVFDDPSLNLLIQRARENNLDLRQALARLAVARALRGESAAALWPKLNSSGSYTWQRISETGIISDLMSSGSQSQAAAGVPSANVSPGLDRNISLWQAGFDSSWELDLFGRIRHLVEASQAEVEASAAEASDVLVSLLGDVAREYINLRKDQALLRIAEQANDSRTRTLMLTEQLERQGLAPDFDVVRARAQVASTTAEITGIQSNIQTRFHRLAVLTGENPESLSRDFLEGTNVPYPSKEALLLPLPADLLRVRPDLRRAERKLAAEVARIGAAEADLYPRVTLAGTLGWSTTDLDAFGASKSLFASIGPSVSWSIFDAGAVRARISAADARALEANFYYRQTALRALEEVENALVRYRAELNRSQTFKMQVVDQTSAFELARQRYEKGISSFLEVLDAERELLASRNQLATSSAEVSTSLVALYKSLGGGWPTSSGHVVAGY